MPKLTINGREVEVEAGTSVLKACEKLGLEIPRFCYHPRLSVAGCCRMCLVEVDKASKPVASCATPCTDGMVVHTDTDAVKAERQGVLEMLLINHPLDCPVCDQGGACDLQDLAFAYGRGLSRCTECKRRVGDPDLGPLVKTAMNRCIHCTRCIRFMDEVAGTREIGGFYRGESLTIAPLYEGLLRSELSGNLIDICPVGALVSKPNAFRFRPWELTRTNGIDVMDAVGSNISIDSRGGEVMRIVPRVHEDVNEEWISDKTRFVCDGLTRGRLDTPLVRDGAGNLETVSWEEALAIVADRMKTVPPVRAAALVGDMQECESIFVLARLLDLLDIGNRDCRQDGAEYDTGARASYIMNTGISGIDRADALLLVGTNPRHEATIVDARIYKRWRRGGISIGLIGSKASLHYAYQHVGHSPVVLRDLIEGKNPFAHELEKARNPMVILGANALARLDGGAIHAAVHALAERFSMVREGWNGYNVLQSAAARVGALDLGFLPQWKNAMPTRSILAAAQGGRLDFLYLLGADEIDVERLGKTFVVYQGHHNDRGASRADVILPAAAYTEKDGTYVNLEGRVQRSARAIPPPGSAREDWSIISDLARAIGKDMGLTTLDDVRRAMCFKYPHLACVGGVVSSSWRPFGFEGTLSLQAFAPTDRNYYVTNAICRASMTMAACAQQAAQSTVMCEERGGNDGFLRRS